MDTQTANKPPIHSLGKRIRDLRLNAGKTLAQVAGETGLSRGFLSQVENGQTNLSLSALYRIAGALETTAPDLLTEGNQPKVSVVRHDEGEWHAATDYNADQVARSLLSAPRKEIEAHECVIPAGFRSDPAWSHAGQEFLFVLKGHMTIEIEDMGNYELHAGDAITYDARMAHRWIGLGDETRVLNVISLPN